MRYVSDKRRGYLRKVGKVIEVILLQQGYAHKIDTVHGLLMTPDVKSLKDGIYKVAMRQEGYKLGYKKSLEKATRIDATKEIAKLEAPRHGAWRTSMPGIMGQVELETFLRASVNARRHERESMIRILREWTGQPPY